MSHEEFIKAYETALASKKWEIVEPLISDKASVTFSNGMVHMGKNEVQKAFENNFKKIKNEKYKMENISWLKKEPKYAVYLFQFHWTGKVNDTLVSGSGIGTSVIIKEKENWKLLTEHLGKGHPNIKNSGPQQTHISNKIEKKEKETSVSSIHKSEKFKAKLEIIVGNPFVFIPSKILDRLFQQANKNKGAIPVRGTINGLKYQQTLLKYSGDWRLYINMKMLKNSPKRIGEIIEVEIEFDPSDRTIKPHPKFVKALAENKAENDVFEKLSPSKQKEIVRYISNLKTEKSVDKNVIKAINFLLGKERFVGRDKP